MYYYPCVINNPIILMEFVKFQTKFNTEFHRVTHSGARSGILCEIRLIIDLKIDKFHRRLLRIIIYCSPVLLLITNEIVLMIK